jgi:hypothetical protein
MKAEIFTTSTPISYLVLTTKALIAHSTDSMEFTWLPADGMSFQGIEWNWIQTGGQYEDDSVLSTKYQELCDSSEISCFDERYISFFVSKILNGEK